MTAADELKKYLQIEEMEKGPLNNTLNELLDKVNEKTVSTCYIACRGMSTRF